MCAPAGAVAAPVAVRAVPPPALPTGGTVAVLAPASPGVDRSADIRAWLASRGFQARFYPSALVDSATASDYLAGSDAQRLDDLHAAFADPCVHAILCLRGGYGSARLLPRIDFDLLRRHAKPLVGFSDITALHLALARHGGFVTFHGPMPASGLLSQAQAFSADAMFTQLQGRQIEGSFLPHPPEPALQSLRCGVTQGYLIGGNLSVIASTLGTPWEIDTQDTILFIEDKGEAPYKIDRLLTQLQQAGKLQALRGVLIGHFSGLSGPDSSPAQKASAEARLQRLWQEKFLPLGVPVLAGWRSGHCNPNLTLPLGARVTLDADRACVRVDQALVADATSHQLAAG